MMDQQGFPVGRSFQLHRLHSGRYLVALKDGFRPRHHRMHDSEAAARFAGWLWAFDGFVAEKKVRAK